MTCIAGVAHEGVVWMAGDCGMYGGNGLVWRGPSKLIVRRPYLLASSGTRRNSDLLRVFDPPEPPVSGGQAVAHFLSTEFAGALRKTLREHGALSVEKCLESMDDSRVMIGVRGELFLMDTHFGVVHLREGFGAIGCGEEMAGAVLWATADLLKPHERTVRAALAAEHLSTAVHGPLSWVSTEDFQIREVEDGRDT